MGPVFDFFKYFVSGRSGFVFEIVICELLFAIGLKPRKYAWISIPLAVAIHLLFGLHVPYFNRVTLVIFALSILLQFAILKASIHRIIFNSVAAYATQSLALNLRSIIVILTGSSGWWSLLIAYLTDAVVYAICYFVFAKQAQNNELHVNYFYLYVIAFLTVFITNVLFWYLTKAVGTRIEAQLTFCICCVISLMLQYNAFRSGIVNYERTVLERLLYMEQTQHEITQESIEIINLKSHDLKRQIATMKEVFGDKDTAEIFGEAERALEVYDNSITTNNKNLDLIVNTEKMICDKHGIKLEIMADGALLNFMLPADIYSLFGNALRNAIESLQNEEEKYRTITMNIHENCGGNYVVVEIKNPCTKELHFQDGRPLTSKEDTRFHGYGIRSMEYIVKKYNGNMVINYQDNVFLVKILFKKQSK